MKKVMLTLLASVACACTMADEANPVNQVTVDFTKEKAQIRRELHSSGFGPRICSTTPEVVEDIKSMHFLYARTHDWALINQGQRVCDYFHIFPLMHLDAKDPKNYYFKPTDYLLKRTREETGHKIFFRLGTSIEHSGKIHFNALIPEDFEKVAESFAGTVRHYNKGWADGFEWDIQYWEIWNEPDGITNMWCDPNGNRKDWKGHRQKFVKFFVTVLKRLKSEFPGIKVGGPALCGPDEGYIRDLLKACKEAGVAPDFISWHAYRNNADSIMADAEKVRKICDEYGFSKCELINNEWHYFGDYTWEEFASKDPAVQDRVHNGVNSHNGIKAAVYTLETLSKFQTSKYDQAYYYGCNHKGSWGYKGENHRKYKVYYALKLFGEIVTTYKTIVESVASDKGIASFAGLSADGKKGFVLVGAYDVKDPVKIDVSGVSNPKNLKAIALDYTRDLVEVDVKWNDGKIVFPRKATSPIAYMITFDL